MLFICSECGKMLHDEFEIENEKFMELIKRKIKCECGASLSMINSYPSIAANELLNVSNVLFKQCKNEDKENKSKIIDDLKHFDIVFDDMTLLDNYINLYEKVRSSEKDNCRDTLLDIGDNYIEKLLLLDVSEDTAICLHSIISTHDINSYRKIMVITIASCIEQLFNDYFTLLIQYKLGDIGAIAFMKEYEYFGIQRCLDIIDAFTVFGFAIKINSIVSGYSDRWERLRRIRNNIIHSNEKYITKNELGKIYRLLDESIKVYSVLKSELYKNYNTTI